MTDTPKRSRRLSELRLDQKTPKKQPTVTMRSCSPSIQDLGNTTINKILESSPIRKSGRKLSPNKKFNCNFGTELKEQKHSRSRSGLKDSKGVRNHVFESDNNTDIDCEGNSGQLNKCFDTPKKRGETRMTSPQSPKTPKTTKTPKTPKTTRNSLINMEPKTPKHIRSQYKKEIAKLANSSSSSCSDFSADGSEIEPSSDSSEEESSDEISSEPENGVDKEEPSTGRRPIIVPILPKTPSRKCRPTSKSQNDDYIPESDAYFLSHSSKKAITSENTLDKLKNSRLPVDQLFNILATVKTSTEHENCIELNLDEYQTYFTKWMYILNEGYNILLYGLGSKRGVLQHFHKKMLSQQTVLVINGFFPDLTIKEILNSITSDILDLSSCSGNYHQIVSVIEEEFNLIPETHLFLIVHNIDGCMLRTSKAQEILSRLAKIKNIHLIASIDHINAPLLWDQTKLCYYNFSWWDITTMLPYTEEISYENSFLLQNSGELALSSLRNVFQSLPSNTKGIFMLIAKHQLENKDNKNYQGMSFKDLYRRCRESFLVSSDLTLRVQLTEFHDHKLVKSKRNVDGSEHLKIPIQPTLLEQFLEEQPQ